jgi:hypothetical protein
VLFVVGESLENPIERFVALSEETLLPIESTFEGIEISLKIQALLKKVPFDDSTIYVWTLIEKLVFGTNSFSKSTPAVSQILTDYA